MRAVLRLLATLIVGALVFALGVAGLVLAGDFLLAQASRIVAETAPALVWSFADWLGELTALRAARLDPDTAVPASEPFAALFEFPARIGGELGGCGPEELERLRAVGLECGRAFLFAEEVLALRGRRTRLDTTLDGLVRTRNSDRSVGDAADAARECRAAEQRGLAAVAGLSDPTAARLLGGLLQAVAEPAHDESHVVTN